MAADKGGSATTTTTSSSSSSSSTVFRTFRALVESADQKFARVRDLPPYGGGLRHHQDAHHHYYRKVFKAYTRLWKFQQENRLELVESGLRRWEIGEIASRIGQLYYGQYLRTSEVRFLLESYVFYEAILSRGYFEVGKEKGSPQPKPDLGVRSKELRFYARFVIVALLLNRLEVVRVIVEKFRALVEDCRVSFPETNFKEWKQVVHEIVRFLKVDRGFTNTRPLRYNVLFDSYPSSHPYVARFRAPRVLRLQDALLTSYRRNEVKFTELTLDTFRMLQCLEWEPSGSFYQTRATESSDNGAVSDQSGVSGLIDINLAADMTDPSLPPNPRKAILYRPSVPHLIAVIASICEELSPDSVMLIYISASGKSDQNIAFQKKHNGTSRDPLNVNAVSETCHRCDSSPSQPPTLDRGDSNDCCGGCLWLGSRGSGGQTSLYPADLIPFTRRPLFLIIDSDNSHAFKVVHGAERGETAALLLSHGRPILQSPSAADLTSNGNQFTFFLTAPLQAFCQLVGLFSDIEVDVYDKAEKMISSAFSEWEVILCTSSCLDRVWAQVLPDPFLRRLILRFIFCRSVLSLFCLPGKGSQYLPDCMPDLPDSVSPDSSSVQSNILHLAESLGVANHFHFAGTVESSTHGVPL